MRVKFESYIPAATVGVSSGFATVDAAGKVEFHRDYPVFDQNRGIWQSPAPVTLGYREIRDLEKSLIHLACFDCVEHWALDFEDAMYQLVIRKENIL